MPYAIDLFCGAGGFSEGIFTGWIRYTFSSDRSPMAQETYVNRHRQLGLEEGVDTHFELADIKDLTSERIFEVINNLRYGKYFEPGDIDVIFEDHLVKDLVALENEMLAIPEICFSMNIYELFGMCVRNMSLWRMLPVS